MSKLEHPRPAGLLHNPGFSQVVVASGTRTIYTAGQVSIDERGALVGADDLAAQTEQAMRNVGLALAAAGASYAAVVKITTYVVTTSLNTAPSSARREPPSSRTGRRQRAPSSVSPRSRCRNGSSRSKPSLLLTDDRAGASSPANRFAGSR
jgi:enamine deaminase RidA (YjgF/YER057c/UK114 family)